jgi:hypothetical protein
MTKQLTVFSGLSGVILFIVTTLLGGFLISDYSHIAQFISESYAIDTPYGKHLRYFGFLPSGICLTIFGFSAWRNFPESTTATKVGFYGLGIFYGLGTVVVSFFPCDKGCNKALIDPTISQLIHNLTGLLTYSFVPFSLILIGWSLRQRHLVENLSYLALAAGLISIFFICLLMSNALTEYAGLFQRIIEGSILLWIVVCSVQIQSNKTLNS